MTPCSLVHGYHRFARTYHRPEDGSETFLGKVYNHLQGYMVSEPRVQ
jgi:hypothetical protein